MLDAEILQSLPDELVERWNELETEMLSDIASRIRISSEVNPSTAWKINKLKEIGLHQDYINSKLSKMLNVSEKEVRSLMQIAVNEGLFEDEKILKQAQEQGLISNITANPTVLNPILEEGLYATNGAIRNFTKTYAAALSKTYENAIDKAYFNVASGFMSPEQASKKAVEELFNYNDLPDLVTKDGRIEQIGTVVARSIRTGVNQSISKMQIANLEDLGCDLVEVSSHYGARPSHAIWQGQIYSLSGKSKKYPNFRTATGFGTGEGLCGWNCRHSFYPYFEGLSTLSADKIDEEKNERVYSLQQKKRALERQLGRYTKKQKVYSVGGVDTGVVTQKIIKTKKAIANVNELLEFEYKYPHFIDVTDKYFKNATPGIGKITFENNYNFRDSVYEIEVAEWLIDIFGKDIKMLTEDNINNIHDCIWKNERWEIKRASSNSTVESRIRKGIIQIKGKGGIVLGIEKYMGTKEELFHAISKRILKAEGPIDVILKDKKGLNRVIKYKK